MGTIPIVFALTTRSTTGLPLDTQQRYELLLTAAQSLYAAVVLLDPPDRLGPSMLLGLSSVQFVVSVTASGDTNRLVIVILLIGYGAEHE